MDMFCACHAQDGQEFMGLFCAPTTRSSRNTLLSASATAAKEGSDAEERLGLKATTGSGSAIHDEIFGKGVEKAETETPLSDAFHKAWGGDASYTAVSRYFLQSETFNLTETVGSLRLLSIPAFGNVNVIDTGAGLVMIDTAINAMAPQIVDIVHKAFPNKVVTHCIYTHGHRDHACYDGFSKTLEAECVNATGKKTCVVAHRNLRRRFDRYRITPGYNGYINNRQMQTEHGTFMPHMMDRLRYPDVEYEDTMTLDVGGVHMELQHFKGETDDCTITWLPASKMLLTGDFWIWSMPNAGNPQKVQRFPREWSECFKAMADFGAEYVFPGHGPPILGRGNIRRAFLETASFLDGVINPCLRLINEGFSLNYLQTNVRKPAVDPLTQVFLQNNYDDWRFLIVNTWRLYAGGWDQNPAHLLPGPEADVANEVADLAGGPVALAKRAQIAMDSGNLELATVLAEWAGEAAPSNAHVHETRANIYKARAARETTLMVTSIFSDAQQQSMKVVKGEAAEWSNMPYIEQPRVRKPKL